MTTAPADAGADAPPLSEYQRRCAVVGVGFCAGQVRCRPFTNPTPDGCEARWFIYQCDAPELLTEDEASACAAAWKVKADDCRAWWAAQYIEQTAPRCAEIEHR